MNPDRSLSQRTSHIELPAGDEIMHISDAEEKRTLRPERKAVHYPKFETILALYGHFRLDTTIFTDMTLEAPEILDTGAKHNTALVEKILQSNLSEKEVSLLRECYHYLSEEDEPQSSDFIFVFGAKTPLRAERAVELYRANLAPKIIFSGRGPFYGKTEDSTEAEQYAAIALKEGVPEEEMIIEDASITIPDNVRRTLNMLDLRRIPYSSFILVNSPYTQRRGWCAFKKHTPEEVKIYRSNCGTGAKFAPGSWYKNSDGLTVVLGEFVKLRETMSFNDA